jgi:hypothetical protein
MAAAARLLPSSKRGSTLCLGWRGWRWHDLRRTARTGMTRLGVPRDHAEAAINHVSGRSALERTYDRHDYAGEIVSALGCWQAHVAGLVAGASAGAVVPTRARQAAEGRGPFRGGATRGQWGSLEVAALPLRPTAGPTGAVGPAGGRSGGWETRRSYEMLWVVGKHAGFR